MVLIDGIDVDLKTLVDRGDTLLCGSRHCGIGYYQEGGLWYANVCYGDNIVQLKDHDLKDLRDRAERMLIKLYSGWLNSI